MPRPIVVCHPAYFDQEAVTRMTQEGYLVIYAKSQEAVTAYIVAERKVGD